MKRLILLLMFLIPAVSGFGQSPTTNATDPEARDSADVISIYGDTYTSLSGVNYDPNWGQSGHTQVNPTFDPGTGNVVLAYPNFNYQGTEIPAQNAAGMEFLHVDIWVPSGTDRMVKVSPINSGTGSGEVLVEVPVTPGSWNSVDIPKADFTGMTWDNVIQMKFDGQFNGDGSANTTPFDIYVDNVFFWKNASSPTSDATLSDLQIDGATIDGFNSALENYTVELPQGTTTVPQITTATATNANATVTITQASGIPGDATVEVESEDATNTITYTVSFVEKVAPAVAAPAPPIRDAADVISIYSDAYTDIALDALSADFDNSDVVEVMIEGNATLEIDFTNFIGIDFSSNKQDASGMTHFHMDFWTSSDDLTGKVFNSKFSQWGGTSAEVSAFELPINTGTTPSIVSGSWVSIDVPISDWTNAPQVRDDIAQFLITSNLDVVFVDNIYLYNDGTGSGNGGGTMPMVAAPAPPARDAADVISIYSDAYTDIALDALSADFDNSDVNEVMIEGNSTLEIDFTDFVGIDFSSNKQDASAMTHFHMDFWTSSEDLVGKVFNSKFSQWGGTSAEVSAFELPVNTGTDPAIVSGSWVSIDVPISAFSNSPQTRDDIAQFLITSNLDTVFVDNIYLYKDESSTGSGPSSPMVAAPTPPARDAADVISIYSDAYTDIALDALSADFDNSDVSEIMIEGNSTLEIDFTDFVGIDFSSNKQDASAMTHFHMDFWTSSDDLVGKVFNSKFSQWGGTSAEVSAFELPINTGTTPAIVSGSWVSIDVPISAFTNSPQTRDDIAQFLITSNLDTVFVDNIYLYNDGSGTGGPQPGEELLANGDFEGATADPWTVNFGDMTVPVQEDGGNKFFFADVETAGDAFAVNLSQQVPIVQGLIYTLSFDASSSGNGRTMLAGIGLSEEPFTNNSQSVELTSSSQTFTLDLAAGFESPNSRVLFDMGADTGIVVIDNVSLQVKEDTGNDPMPMVAAPTPTQDQADVISLFSSAYTDVTVDTWRAGFSAATFTDSVDIDGTPVKKYSALDFVGIETVSSQVDASTMTNFSIDVWSADFTSFSVKLVDFGADGAFDGGDDTEHQVDFSMPNQSEWVTFDIPLEDFTGLTTKSNIAQYILVGQPTGATTIFVDNMFFYDNEGTSIDDENVLPDGFALNQNYPNPFNPSTNISYNLPSSGEVTLEVFNIQGQRVATLENGFKTAGSYTVTFDASHLASGVYTYRLVSENSVKVKKMLLIK